MNKRTTILSLSAFACALSITSCTTVGGEMHSSTSPLYYQNETNADTEEYTFLRSVYELANHEIEFAKIINERGSSANVKSLAQQISTQLKEVQTKISTLSEQSHVLVPYPGMSDLTLADGLDSAQGPALEKAYIEQSLHNQEEIIHQVKTVEGNTKKSVRDYAEELLPTLEKTLEETKALL